MVVHMEVASSANVEVESTVCGELTEHVIEEANPFRGRESVRV
jgi:hypothetical protein